MSIRTLFEVLCDDCGFACKGVRDSAKEIRKAAREVGWVYRPNPATKGMLDLCPTCRENPKYRQALDVAAEAVKFDAAIACAGGEETTRGAYWRYLQTLFFDGVRAERPQPFSHYSPMFEEEFS